MQLAASTGEVGIVRTERKSPVKQRSTPVLDDLPEAEEGVAPCIRPECREVIRDIYDRQAKNEAERDDIIQECEKMIQIHQQLEEETLMIDDDNKRIILEGNMLEESYQTLLAKYAKCKTIKLEKETERDELNSKVCYLFDILSEITLIADAFGSRKTKTHSPQSRNTSSTLRYHVERHNKRGHR